MILPELLSLESGRIPDALRDHPLHGEPGVVARPALPAGIRRSRLPVGYVAVTDCVCLVCRTHLIAALLASCDECEMYVCPACDFHGRVIPFGEWTVPPQHAASRRSRSKATTSNSCRRRGTDAMGKSRSARSVKRVASAASFPAHGSGFSRSARDRITGGTVAGEP